MTYLPHNSYIRPLLTHDALHNRQYISLQHSHIAHGSPLSCRGPGVLDSHFAQRLNEVHDVCARVHVCAL